MAVVKVKTNWQWTCPRCYHTFTTNYQHTFHQHLAWTHNETYEEMVKMRVWRYTSKYLQYEIMPPSSTFG